MLTLLPGSSALAITILSASFNGDFAELRADRFVACDPQPTCTNTGAEVNRLVLFDPRGIHPSLDLSLAFFGDSDAIFGGGTRLIDQGPLQTGIHSAPIAASFFPVLASGLLGLDITITDTDDAQFAMDFLSIDVVTPTGLSTLVLLDEHNGFGIGLPDGANLPAVLPFSVPPIGVGGDGFDETLGSKAINVVIPEPSTVVLLGTGLLLGLVGLRRRYTR
jgi:hypothetical protein